MGRNGFLTAPAIVLIAATVLAGCNRGGEPPAGQSSGAGNAAAADSGTVSADGINVAFVSKPEPPRSGDNAIEVIVTDRANAPVTDATVEATFVMPPMPSMNMPAMRSNAPLTHQGNGRYTGTGQLSMAGTWLTTIVVSRNGQQVATKRLSLNAN